MRKDRYSRFSSLIHRYRMGVHLQVSSREVVSVSPFIGPRPHPPTYLVDTTRGGSYRFRPSSRSRPYPPTYLVSCPTRGSDLAASRYLSGREPLPLCPRGRCASLCRVRVFVGRLVFCRCVTNVRCWGKLYYKIQSVPINTTFSFCLLLFSPTETPDPRS